MRIGAVERVGVGERARGVGRMQDRGGRVGAPGALHGVRNSNVVIGNYVDNRAFRQGCRLVENKAALLDTCSERAHAVTLRVSDTPGKRSCCPKRVDLAEPGDDLVPTSPHWGTPAPTR